jgi:acyl-lipid omega-6 desaturase (Delta-12 desaturase)
LHQAHQTIKRLAAHCNQYRKPDARRAITQIVTTVIPCVLVAVAMYWSLGISYWLTLLLAVPMAGLVIRLFIIQHDCGHGSFFASQKVNTWLGRVLSVLTLTPYADWRRDHALHHASSANLDRRGVGDIDTLTVAEYRALPRHRRLWYRVYRNPLFLVFIGAPIHFLILQRFPKNLRWAERSLWSSVLALNVAIIAVYGSLMLALGWRDTLLLVLPVFFLSSAIGVWLFFVQHQFEETYWARNADWDRKTAAILGSSYYVLPPVLRWFTGNIGLHHVHHLCSQVPNYRLQECVDACPELQEMNRLTIWQSIRTAHLGLWDEESGKLVGFSGVMRPRRRARAGARSRRPVWQTAILFARIVFSPFRPNPER